MLRILLIDDNPDDRLLVTRQLQQEFSQLEVCSVIDANSFEEVLDAGNFDAAIIDYQLRWNDGLTLLNAIKAKYPDCPVIMFTDTGSEEVAVAGMKSGLSDYVLKGKPQRLSLALRQSLEQQRIREEYAMAVEQLQLSEERLRLALEAAYLGTWDWNVLTGEIVWSENHERLFGVLPGSFGGTYEAFLACLHPDDKERVAHAITSALETKTDFYCEFRVVWSNGSIHWISSRGKFYYNKIRQATRMIGVVLDITERKRREEELEQTNRLKDEFLAVVSHELRTPLNAILGWAKLLRSRNFDQATQNRSLEIIERNAIQQNLLINDILDTSVLTRGQMQLEASVINLVTVMENALNTVRLSAEAKSIILVSIIDSQEVLVKGDANRLQQVVWNLLANAIKYTQNGGKVEVRSVKQEDGSYAQITVSDNGIGISPDFLPYVFERFRQGDGINSRSRNGLGLGLAIANQLVEMHGGTISAHSDGLGLGATFTVKLPLLKDLKQEQQARSNSSCVTLLHGLKILAVDDDVDNLELIAEILQGEGANVTALSQADAALQILPELNPDVLVSDIGMQPIDGYELMRQIRSLEAGQSRNLPAIALTAYAREEDKIQVLATGFQMYLSKPVDPIDLVTAISNLVHKN
ncbi:response regulator [Iningainema tapete]|uniref:histidine kinase n=1 Tax=Iningainema tapete BLCC-T55 TaxID=2748662 RepID=A0A8J7C7X7_9CYAN|nr:response regulator [Iningainema tapete]MBD2776309.1 response regulator [Iningainema tapete BLCC-T55]